MPYFGRLRLDTIDHARVSAWFDAASVDRPGAANFLDSPKTATPSRQTRSAGAQAAQKTGPQRGNPDWLGEVPFDQESEVTGSEVESFSSRNVDWLGEPPVESPAPVATPDGSKPAKRRYRELY